MLFLQIQETDYTIKRLNKSTTKQINNYTFQEGPKGFEGGMTAKKHMSINQTSKATATRDLSVLEKLGAFIITGSGRNTNYHLNLGK